MSGDYVSAVWRVEWGHWRSTVIEINTGTPVLIWDMFGHHELSFVGPTRWLVARKASKWIARQAGNTETSARKAAAIRAAMEERRETTP